MKLIFFIHDRPKYLGGPIINLSRILPEFMKRGFEPYLLSFYSEDYPNTRYLQSLGIKAFARQAQGPTVEHLRWVLEKVEEIQPDIYIPDVSIPGCLAGKWIRAAGIPVVNMHRSDDDYNWRKALFFSDNSYGFQSSAIVCVSQYLQNRLKEKINLEIPSVVIPSGVPLSEYVADHENSGMKIVYAGRLFETQKRVSLMIDRMLSLCKKYPDLSVTIIGDGPEKNECIRKVNDSDFSDRICFLGNLYGNDYHRVMAQHNILLLLSDYEGTPGSVMDGMSCGLVPVVLRYNGLEDLVTSYQSGIIVENRDGGLNEAIEFLYHNKKQLKRLGANARNHIAKNFTIDVSVNKWEALFTDLNRNTKRKMPFKAPKRIKLPKNLEANIPYHAKTKKYVIKQFIKKLRSRVGKRSLRQSLSCW